MARRTSGSSRETSAWEPPLPSNLASLASQGSRYFGSLLFCGKKSAPRLGGVGLSSIHWQLVRLLSEDHIVVAGGHKEQQWHRQKEIRPRGQKRLAGHDRCVGGRGPGQRAADDLLVVRPDN